MKQLKPVLWTKGTFLTPQHLQVQDRFIEDALNFRLQALKFCPWGFRELSINAELLTEGQFAVTRATGIFPMDSCSRFRRPIRRLRPSPWKSSSNPGLRVSTCTWRFRTTA